MTADLRDTMRRFYKEVLENGNIDAVDDFVAEDYIEHDTFPGLTLAPGREGLKQLVAGWTSAFSDVHIEVIDSIQQGDTAAVYATFHGTHTGELAGIAPTGTRVAVNISDWVRFENGKGVEHWSVNDTLSLLTQLGVIPPM